MGNIIYTLPAGAQYTLVAYKNISLKAAGTAVAVDLGIGSLIGSGAQSVLSGVGATAEDYLTGVATTTSSTGGFYMPITTGIPECSNVSTTVAATVDTTATASFDLTVTYSADTGGTNNIVCTTVLVEMAN